MKEWQKKVADFVRTDPDEPVKLFCWDDDDNEVYELKDRPVDPKKHSYFYNCILYRVDLEKVPETVEIPLSQLTGFIPGWDYLVNNVDGVEILEVSGWHSTEEELR